MGYFGFLTSDTSAYPLIAACLTVIGSAIGVCLTIAYQLKAGKRRATIDLAIEQIKDKALGEAAALVHKMHVEKQNLSAFCSKHGSDEYNAIGRVLNSHELVASGIKEGAYDENLYKRMKYTSVCLHWEALNGYVHQMRTNMKSDTLYQDFEWLAKRWCKKPLKKEQ